MGFPGGSVVETLTANVGDTRDLGLIPGLGRSQPIQEDPWSRKW